MKICDGVRAIDIEIKKWNGSGYDPDWSQDYFTAGCLPSYDTPSGEHVYKVGSVQYAIDMAKSTDEEGACAINVDEDGNPDPDGDMCVFVEELPIQEYTYRIMDFESSAAALYDGGWRKEDKEELMAEYALDEDDADKLVGMLAKMGGEDNEIF